MSFTVWAREVWWRQEILVGCRWRRSWDFVAGAAACNRERGEGADQEYSKTYTKDQLQDKENKGQK